MPTILKMYGPKIGDMLVRGFYADAEGDPLPFVQHALGHINTVKIHERTSTALVLKNRYAIHLDSPDWKNLLKVLDFRNHFGWVIRQINSAEGAAHAMGLHVHAYRPTFRALYQTSLLPTTMSHVSLDDPFSQKALGTTPYLGLYHMATTTKNVNTASKVAMTWRFGGVLRYYLNPQGAVMALFTGPSLSDDRIHLDHFDDRAPHFRSIQYPTTFKKDLLKPFEMDPLTVLGEDLTHPAFHRLEGPLMESEDLVVGFLRLHLHNPLGISWWTFSVVLPPILHRDDQVPTYGQTVFPGRSRTFLVPPEFAIRMGTPDSRSLSPLLGTLHLTRSQDVPTVMASFLVPGMTPEDFRDASIPGSTHTRTPV